MVSLMARVSPRCLVAVLVVGLCAATPALSGDLRYPALGNLELRQGTIEFWLIPQFDPMAVESDRYLPMLTVCQDADNYLTLMWRTHAGHTGPYATSMSQGFKHVPLWHLVKDWQPGQAHHVAYCWEPGRNWWVIDGQPQEPRKQSRQHDMRLSEHLALVFGDPDRQMNLVIDDLRISSVVRPPEELGHAQPGRVEADAFTLLLDRFDDAFTCDGRRQTSPEIMMPSAQQRGGLPGPGCRFVEGVSGYGLAF